MVINLQNAEKFRGIESDVRETATVGEIENFSDENTADQDIAVASGWVDLTGMSRTFSISGRRNIIIMGSMQFLPGDDVADFGGEIRIVVNGTAITNSIRTYRVKAKVGVNNVLTDGATTSVSLYTQHVASVNSGSQTIKIQGQAISNGTTFGVRFQKKNMIIMVMP